MTRLKVVKSTQAKNKINQWFKQELKEDNILKGKEMLIQYAKVKAISLGEIQKPKYQEAVMKNMVSETGILFWLLWDTEA